MRCATPAGDFERARPLSLDTVCRPPFNLFAVQVRNSALGQIMVPDFEFQDKITLNG